MGTPAYGKCNTEVAKLLKIADKQAPGAVIKGGRHIRVKAVNGNGFVTVSCSSVSPKTIMDIRRDLRQAGFIL